MDDCVHGTHLHTTTSRSTANVAAGRRIAQTISCGRLQRTSRRKGTANSPAALKSKDGGLTGVRAPGAAWGAAHPSVSGHQGR